jgi:hypothetical protein
MGEMRNAYKILVGRCRHRWENFIMYVKMNRVGQCGLDSYGLGWGPEV